MGSRVQPKRSIIAGLSVIAAALLASASAHAANNSLIPCEKVGRDLKSLEVRAESLSVREVDHAPIDPASLDEPRADNAAAAPILNLTPRVTSILRDVFGTTNDERTQEIQSQPSSSPLADSVEEQDEIEPDDAEIEKRDLPRFQQRMFRKDI